MKVALVSDCYPPRVGGIEVQIRDLAHRLAQAGHQVEVFTATVGPGGERHGAVTDADTGPVHRLARRMPANLVWSPFAGPELRRRLGGGRFDVAHVQIGVLSPLAVDGVRAALDVGLPTVLTWHSMLGPAEGPVRLCGVVRRWAQRGVAMNAVSRVAAARVQRVIGDAGQVAVVPNGIDASTWWRAGGRSSALPVAPGEPVRIISAMRFAARKRPLPMLRVVARARRLAPQAPIHLTVLGEGWLRRWSERDARRLGMQDWVDFPGRVSRPELLRRYDASHLYLSPARLESFGIAALEARCLGLPVVALSSSGAGEFVEDGVNGFLADDDEGMAVALARLVRDPLLRERMFAHNVTHPPAQDWGRVVQATVAEYQRAAALRELAPARR